MKTQHLFSAGVLLALGVACGVEVGIDGKDCPCADPDYVCDPAKNKCVHPSQLTVAPPPPTTCDSCPCEKDADCTDPTRPSCGPNKRCVQCLPGPNDKCGPGTYCNTKNQCTIGCRSNDDCAQLAKTSPFCLVDLHQCVICVPGDNTPCDGKTCTPSGTCATACSDKAPDCCGGLRIDITTDILNCGACGKKCTADNGTPKCSGGVCGADCADGFGTCPGGPGTCLTELRTDTNNCGACGKVCPVGPNVATASCAQAKCQVTCKDGWVNTNDDVADGCETACGQNNGDSCCPGDKCFGTNLTCRQGKCGKGGGGG